MADNSNDPNSAEKENKERGVKTTGSDSDRKKKNTGSTDTFSFSESEPSSRCILRERVPALLSLGMRACDGKKAERRGKGETMKVRFGPTRHNARAAGDG